MVAVMLVSYIILFAEVISTWFKIYPLRVLISPLVWIAWIMLGLDFMADGMVWYDWIGVPFSFLLSYISFNVFRDILDAVYETLTDRPE